MTDIRRVINECCGCSFEDPARDPLLIIACEDETEVREFVRMHRQTCVRRVGLLCEAKAICGQRLGGPAVKLSGFKLLFHALTGYMIYRIHMIHDLS